MSGSNYTLYAVPLSLYAGKARSYMTKQRVPFDEVSTSNPDFFESAFPATKRIIMPVIRTPEGDVVQDGTGIIDWFEQKGKATLSAYADDDRLNVVSLIFELFGGEGLLRPAMHYRWNKFEANRATLECGFGTAAAAGQPRDAQLAVIEPLMDKMRSAGRMFGVLEPVFDLIEQHYEEFLDLLNEHFVTHPYLLGGRPTIGDYGLITAMFAHLGRDPYPLQIMVTKAPYVYRWVERMNRPNPDQTEYINYGTDLFSFADLPQSLLDLLTFVADDYLPEVRAFVDFTNNYLTENDVSEGDVIGGDKPSRRGIGLAEFSYRGVTIPVGVLPYRQWLLQRIQDRFDGLDQASKSDVTALLDKAGLGDILTARVSRRIERQNNLEMWGATA